MQFSQQLAETTVIVSTQPGEPYAHERADAIRAACPGANIYHFHKTIEQNPLAEGFWDMWRNIMHSFGFRDGDYVVASEPYGQQLADEIGGVFMPYDLNRSITPIKATYVRNSPWPEFHKMIPEFRRKLISRVTIFGAESCGKSTLTRELGTVYNAQWLFEWARPYLETIGADLTEEKMEAIWHGQAALQRSADFLLDSPVVFQDTDLYSTVGYWDLNNLGVMTGPSPDELRRDADLLKSDLYLVCPSNIPMEQDQLRYAGAEREASDEYWIGILEKYNLPYKLLTANTVTGKVAEATKHINALVSKRLDMTYERQYN